MKIQIAKTNKEIKECFLVMKQLRTTLTEDEFLRRVQLQEKEGYKLAYVEANNMIVAVAGFRIMHNLAYGKHLFVDDLITDEQHRSQGYGDKLFDFLVVLAKQQNCDQFHLDSGVQRFDAHRFYLRKKMSIISHHFGLNLRERT